MLQVALVSSCIVTGLASDCNTIWSPSHSGWHPAQETGLPEKARASGESLQVTWQDSGQAPPLHTCCLLSWPTLHNCRSQRVIWEHQKLADVWGYARTASEENPTQLIGQKTGKYFKFALASWSPSLHYSGQCPFQLHFFKHWMMVCSQRFSNFRTSKNHLSKMQTPELRPRDSRFLHIPPVLCSSVF